MAVMARRMYLKSGCCNETSTGRSFFETLQTLPLDVPYFFS